MDTARRELDLAQGQLGERIGELERRACRRWVGERFSQRRMVHDYLEVYERILSGEPTVSRVAG